jgi:hypothetical protein
VNECVRKTNAELKKEGGVGMEKMGMQSSLLNFDLTVQVSQEERGYLTVQVSREKRGFSNRSGVTGGNSESLMAAKRRNR